jgi:hypothetical protein
MLAVALALAICVAVAIVLLTSSTSPRTSADVDAYADSAASSGGCSAAAERRADRALEKARARYLNEAQGAVIHIDLHQIAHDATLIGALSSGHLGAALVAANRQLVRHVVQIRVLQGSRVLVDANPTSFDVRGSAIDLRNSTGRSLGRLAITVQDVIGFNKLVHKLDAADALVRGAAGQLRTTLPAAAHVSLPRSGCTQIGSRTHVVRSFDETSFTGEALTIWILTAA